MADGQTTKRSMPWLLVAGALVLVSLLAVVLWLQSDREPDVAAQRQESAELVPNAVPQPVAPDAAPAP